MYRPIGDYGAIGNLHTVALVSRAGSIDWLCLPDLDSPSVFGALLDDERGGRFAVAPVGDNAPSAAYLPGTNVLVTRFVSGQAETELTDFMPVLPAKPGREALSRDLSTRAPNPRAGRHRAEFRPPLRLRPRRDAARLGGGPGRGTGRRRTGSCLPPRGPSTRARGRPRPVGDSSPATTSGCASPTIRRERSPAPAGTGRRPWRQRRRTGNPGSAGAKPGVTSISTASRPWWTAPRSC